MAVRASGSFGAISSWRRTASRTNALMLIPVRAATLRSSASSRSSMRILRVAKARVPSAASASPAEILFPICGTAFQWFAQLLSRRDAVSVF